MTETVLMSPGGASEAKQDDQLVALSTLAREATLAAVGVVLTQLRDITHGDLIALAQQLAGTLTVETGLQQPTRPTDTQPISAVALPLPAGAATEAKQLPDNHQVTVSNLPDPITGFALEATLQAVRDRLPTTPLAQGLTNDQLRAQAVSTQDDYATVLYLEQQTSSAIAPILTFNFGQPVRKVWVRLMAANADDNSTATVRADGGDPTATIGTVIDAGVTFPISTPPTNAIKVLPPVGKTVAVYGHTR